MERPRVGRSVSRIIGPGTTAKSNRDRRRSERKILKGIGSGFSDASKQLQNAVIKSLPTNPESGLPAGPFEWPQTAERDDPAVLLKGYWRIARTDLIGQQAEPPEWDSAKGAAHTLTEVDEWLGGEPMRELVRAFGGQVSRRTAQPLQSIWRPSRQPIGITGVEASEIQLGGSCCL